MSLYKNEKGIVQTGEAYFIMKEECSILER